MYKYLRQNIDIFFYLLFLTVFFILTEVSFFAAANRSYIADLNLAAAHLQVPFKIFKAVSFFIGIQLLIHFLFCVMTWLVSMFLSAAFKINNKNILYFSIAIWSLCLMTILATNAYYFPNSAFSLFLYNNFFAFILFKILLFLNITIIFTALFYSRNIYLILLIMISLLIFLIISHSQNENINKIIARSKPNIIVIGVDSLRPDFLSYFGQDIKTPFIDSFLEKSTVFAEALTPLARTFPAWTSILTGEYPIKHGVRTNLNKQNKLNLSQSLPNILKQNGYKTLYASDEARFSNIDKNYGFEEIITPPMGINDFLMGTLNDFPLSNWMINTKLGSWLFPYNYANRASYVNYDPNSFLKRLADYLSPNSSQPLFLAVHFCLPHMPYSWKDLSERDFNIRERYKASIARVDKQLADFFVLLQKNHILDHAMVVLLSDHGEALELPGDRITQKEFFVKKNISIPIFYPSKENHETIDRSAGHGTDVLGLSQYHTLLAFQEYGKKTHQPQLVKGMVTLLSIKPTILDWLHLKDKQPNALSLSLLSIIKKQTNSFVLFNKPIFLESDFSPDAILSVHPDIQEALLAGIKIYEIDSHTLRLSVKEDMYQKIIDSKQYAVILDDWMLALYPQANHSRIPILINLKTLQWTNDLHSTFAKLSPADKMLKELRYFYNI